MSRCAECPSLLCERNRTGLCRKCHLKRYRRSPEFRERARQRLLANPIGHLGHRSRSPECLKRIGRSRTETLLAWCPRELRDEYRRLLRKRVKAAEAKEMILAQHEKDMAAFRRRLMEEQQRKLAA